MDKSSPEYRYLKLRHDDDEDEEVSFSEWRNGRNTRAVVIMRDGRVAATDNPFAVMDTSVGPVAVLSELSLGAAPLEDGEDEISAAEFEREWQSAITRPQCFRLPG